MTFRAVEREKENACTRDADAGRQKKENRRKEKRLRDDRIDVEDARVLCGPLTKCNGRNISKTDSISSAAGLIYAGPTRRVFVTWGTHAPTRAQVLHACRRLPARASERSGRVREKMRCRARSVPVAAQRAANGNANVECFRGIPGFRDAPRSGGAEDVILVKSEARRNPTSRSHRTDNFRRYSLRINLSRYDLLASSFFTDAKYHWYRV